MDTTRRFSRRLRALSPVPEDATLTMDTHSFNSAPIPKPPIGAQTTSPSTLCQTSLHHHTSHLAPSSSPLNLPTDLQPPTSTSVLQEANTFTTPIPAVVDTSSLTPSTTFNSVQCLPEDAQHAATLDPSSSPLSSGNAVPAPSNCSIGNEQPSNASNKSAHPLSTVCQSDDEWVDIHPETRKCYIMRRHKPIYRPLTLTKTKKTLKLLHRCITNVRDTALQKYCQLVSDIETAKMQVKSEVKTHIKVNCQEQADAMASLASAVRKLELQNTQLKAQVGDLKKQLTTAKRCLGCGSTKASNTSSTPLSPASTLNHSPSLPASPVTTPTPTAKVTVTQSPDPQTPATSLSPFLTPNSSANEKRTQAAPVTKISAATDLVSADINNSSLRQSLLQHQIDTRATHVFIGDSVAKSIISTEILSTQSRQDICVPGLLISDLIEWLKHAPCSKHVQQVTVHAGIHTCRTDVVTASMWSQLLRLLNKVFPNAQLAISSIIPPITRYNSFYKTVSISNLHLKEACQTEKCAYISNASIFCTTRGLPKKAMYNDSISPSPRGAIAVAENIKSTLPPPAPPSVPSTVQSTGSAPLTHPLSGRWSSTSHHTSPHQKASSKTQLPHSSPASRRSVAAPPPTTKPSWAAHLFGQRAVGQVPDSFVTERVHYNPHKPPLLPTPPVPPLRPEYNCSSRAADSHRPHPVDTDRSSPRLSTNVNSRSHVNHPSQYCTPGHAHSSVLQALGQSDQFYSLIHKIMHSVLSSL